MLDLCKYFSRVRGKSIVIILGSSKRKKGLDFVDGELIVFDVGSTCIFTSLVSKLFGRKIIIEIYLLFICCVLVVIYRVLKH